MMFSFVLLGFLVFNRRGKQGLERFDDFSLAHCQTRQTPSGRGGALNLFFMFLELFFFQIRIQNGFAKDFLNSTSYLALLIWEGLLIFVQVSFFTS